MVGSSNQIPLFLFYDHDRLCRLVEFQVRRGCCFLFSFFFTLSCVLWFTLFQVLLIYHIILSIKKSDVGDKLMELVYFSIHTVCTWVGASSFVWCFLLIYFNLPKKIFWFNCLKNWVKRHWCGQFYSSASENKVDQYFQRWMQVKMIFREG